MLFPSHAECAAINTDAGIPLPDYDLVEEEVTLSKGGDAVEFLSDFRGGSGNFYDDSLKNIMIYSCEQDAANKDRCVPVGEAAKDHSGNCIVPLNSPCDGTIECERYSNCYWPPAVVGEERVPRYTTAEADVNENFLYEGGQDSYAYSVGKYAGVGVIFMVFNILIWAVFFIGRCCCCCLHEVCICRCCSSKPKEEGYNVGMQVRIPIFFYIFFVACIVAAAGVAFVGDQDTGKGEKSR